MLTGWQIMIWGWRTYEIVKLSPLNSPQIANPGLWSLCSSLCSSILALQASGRGLEASTRPLSVAASLAVSSRLFCRAPPSFLLFPLERFVAFSRPQSLRLSGTFSFLVWIQLGAVESTAHRSRLFFSLLGLIWAPISFSSISIEGLCLIHFLFHFFIFFLFSD